MGILDRAIKKSINKAVSNTVQNQVNKIVAPTINKAADQVADAVTKNIGGNQTQTSQNYQNQSNMQSAGTQLGGMFSGFAGAAQSFANEAAKDMKICPDCGEPSNANIKFCPKCGTKLPEITVAQGAVCSNCGKQNDIGKKFCGECGTKLPFAIAEEESAKRKDEAVLAKWDSIIPQFPKWCFGGYDYSLELIFTDENGIDYYSFSTKNVGMSALEQYRQLLKQNGFIKAGQYPSESQLYKRINGVVYNFDSEEPFAGGSDLLSINFTAREPSGGFDYVKPEPKKTFGFKDLFK